MDEEAFRELAYIAGEIALCMAWHPDLTAREIAGVATDPDSELARLIRAVKKCRPVHLHHDEVT